MTRGLLAILSGVLTVMLASAALAQTVDLSLNLQYSNPANPALGGAWTLVAKTNSANGIAGINAILSNVSGSGITAQAGIGAVLDFSGPYVNIAGTTVEVVYFQDLSTPAAVVTNVGRGAGTPGNIPLDPLNDPLWNNAARIFSGTFTTPSTPAFTTNTNNPPDVTDANVLATAAAPFSVTAAASITTIVRDNLSGILGDYNGNGVVDAADYTVWRNTFGAAGPGLAADGSGNSLIDHPDYDVWKSRFGMNSGSGASSGTVTQTAVPEPGAMAMIALTMIGTVLICNRRIGGFLATIVFLSTICGSAHALDRTWIGGNVDWVNGGVITNWNPNDEPDADDRAIFNTANTVNLGSNNAINGLALSGGIDLFTNDFDLTVDGLVEVTGAGTSLFINKGAGSIDADDVTINADGTIELRGGILALNEEVGTSLIDINAGGNLIGNGTITFADTPGVVTTVLVNDGELTALSRGLTIITPPPVGTLQINTSGPSFSRVDLDGAGELGIVNVNRNQTLDLNVAFADSFNGTMNLFQQSTFDSLNAWTLAAGGEIVVNNGFVDNVFPTPDISAGTAFIAGGLLTQTGGTIDVTDTDGTLQMDVNFTMSGGTFTNSGTVIFNGTTNITTAAGYVADAMFSETIINGAMTVDQAAGNFNWDGIGTARTTINGTGSLSLTVNQINSASNVFTGFLNLNDDADLSVNDTINQWQMSGSLQKNNAGTSSINGDEMAVNGVINVHAGTLDVNAELALLNPAVLIVAAGGTLTSSTTSIIGADLDIDGTLSLGPLTTEFTPVVFDGSGTVRFNSTSNLLVNTTVNTPTFDWDGTGSGSAHTIGDGVTFTINSTTFDNDGDMDDPINLAGSGSTLIVNNALSWATGLAINANNAGVGTATIGGTSRLILNGASADLNVNGDTDITAPLTFGLSSSASIDAGFTLDADGIVIYDGASILGLGTYDPGITNTVTAQDAQITSTTFDFDAGSWVIEAGGELLVNVTDYDTTVTNGFDNTITLNGGDVNVTTGDAEFILDGTLNMSSTAGSSAGWFGEPLDIGNNTGALDADLNVTGIGISQFGSLVDFNSDADVNVAAGATLQFISGATVNFNTVNGANNAEFTGAGRLEFNGTVNVNEAVTLNMAGGEVDFDGSDEQGNFINIDDPLVINAATFSNFGRVNGGGGINTLDIDNSFGTGVLTVNLDDPNAEWTLNGPGEMNLVNDNAEATLLAGSDVNLNGKVDVVGDVRTTARLDIAGVVNINTAGQPLRLAGGNNTDDPNTISGGTITGVGLLSADTGKALQGFGTINSDIDFNGTSDLKADNGTLTINGAILDASTVGTADVDGTLHVTNAWNNNVATGVQLNGGTLSGGTITNDVVAGISGHGLVTARVINNTQLFALLGDTLIFETAGNDNDWDGVANLGEIEAVSANIELRDVGAAFGFGGTVSATNGHTAFANGFALDFNPGSTLALASGGTYRSTSSTDIGGTVSVGGGGATIEVENNVFLTFETGSSTTLGSNVQLVNNNINFEAGATFSGAGAIVIPDSSNLVADNLADIGVLLDMQGAFRPGNSDGIGRIDLLDYQQANTGELFVELTGTSLNQYDRLVVDGDAVIDGYLNIDIDGGFVPVLGNTFNIITANTRTGEFDFADIQGMPAGLTFHIEYLSNAVQLQVVSTPFFAADFDDDGDVDATDLVIWKGAFDLNQLGDADGDNDSDGADLLIWQREFGSQPGAGAGSGGTIPEPTSLVLLVLALLAIRVRTMLSVP